MAKASSTDDAEVVFVGYGVFAASVKKSAGAALEERCQAALEALETGTTTVIDHNEISFNNQARQAPFSANSDVGGIKIVQSTGTLPGPELLKLLALLLDKGLLHGDNRQNAFARGAAQLAVFRPRFAEQLDQRLAPGHLRRVARDVEDGAVHEPLPAAVRHRPKILEA